jgi:hypothetical protein
MTTKAEDIRKSTGMAETQIGPVVAIQYPEKWEYSENEESAGVIAQKYAHFKTLGPDDPDGYKALIAAIADVRTRRTDVAKQEKVIKDPLNKFRDVVIKTSKSIRGLLNRTEDDLKGIKTRIDDIKLERKLALQKTWQDNISGLTSILQTMGVMDASQLIELLESQSTYVFKPDDFGEFIGQAKSAVAQNVIAITERIDFLAEQKKLKDQQEWQGNLNQINAWATNLEHVSDDNLQETISSISCFIVTPEEFGDYSDKAEEAVTYALNRARVERGSRTKLAEEAAAQKIRDDEKALSDQKTADDAAEMQRMRDQIAAMEKQAEPVPEIVITSQSEVVMVEEILVPDAIGLLELSVLDGDKVHANTVIYRSDENETFTGNLGDINELNAWAKKLETAKELGPVPGLHSEAATNAVNDVYDQLHHLIYYLKTTAEELK